MIGKRVGRKRGPKKGTTEKGDRFIFSVALSYRFRPYGEPLDSLRSPFGPAFGCYSAALRFSLLAQKVTKEKARPASGFRYAQLPSLRHCSEGRHGGPSLAHRSSFGIHANPPSPQHLHSAF